MDKLKIKINNWYHRRFDKYPPKLLYREIMIISVRYLLLISISLVFFINQDSFLFSLLFGMLLESSLYDTNMEVTKGNYTDGRWDEFNDKQNDGRLDAEIENAMNRALAKLAVEQLGVTGATIKKRTPRVKVN